MMLCMPSSSLLLMLSPVLGVHGDHGVPTELMLDGAGLGNGASPGGASEL